MNKIVILNLEVLSAMSKSLIIQSISETLSREQKQLYRQLYRFIYFDNGFGQFMLYVIELKRP